MDPSGYCHRKFYSVWICRLSPLCKGFRPRFSGFFGSALPLLRFSPFSLPFLAFPHLQNRTGLTLSQFLFQWLASLDQALDLLVSASSICYHTSTADLSTSSSLRGLTYLCSGSLILQGGFTLRCLQRLSLPHFASLLCPWQNNSFTRGASIPVLSY